MWSSEIPRVRLWPPNQKKIPNPSSIALLELLATRRATLFFSEVWLDNSILECDSEVIINTYKNGDLYNSALAFTKGYCVAH